MYSRWQSDASSAQGNIKRHKTCRHINRPIAGLAIGRGGSRRGSLGGGGHTLVGGGHSDVGSRGGTHTGRGGTVMLGLGGAHTLVGGAHTLVGGGHSDVGSRGGHTHW